MSLDDYEWRSLYPLQICPFDRSKHSFRAGAKCFDEVFIVVCSTIWIR